MNAGGGPSRGSLSELGERRLGDGAVGSFMCTVVVAVLVIVGSRILMCSTSASRRRRPFDVVTFGLEGLRSPKPARASSAAQTSERPWDAARCSAVYLRSKQFSVTLHECAVQSCATVVYRFIVY